MALFVKFWLLAAVVSCMAVSSHLKEDVSVNESESESESVEIGYGTNEDGGIVGPVECRLYATLLDLPAWDRTTSTLAYTTNGAQFEYINSTFSGHIISGSYIISPQNRAINVNDVKPSLLLVTEGSGSVERFEAIDTHTHTESIYTLGSIGDTQVSYNGIFITGFINAEEGVDVVVQNAEMGISELIKVSNKPPYMYLPSVSQTVGFKQIDNIRFTNQNGEDKKYTIYVNPETISTFLVEVGSTNIITLPSQSDPSTAAASFYLTQTYINSNFYIAAIGRTEADNGYYIYRTYTYGSTPFEFAPVQLVYSEISESSHIPNLIYTPPNTDIIYGCKSNIFFTIMKAYTTLVPKPIDIQFTLPPDTQCRKIISFQNCPNQVYVLLNNMKDGKAESLSSIAYSSNFGKNFEIVSPENDNLAHVDIAGAEVYRAS